MALLRNSPSKTPSLEDRIETLRNEIDAEIDRRAEEIRKTMPGVPIGVVKSIITRNSDCACRSYQRIVESEI